MFICKFCAGEVFQRAPGTKNRNHCPKCLYSVHVDTKIGDRSSKCRGLMKPVYKYYKKDGEEVLWHKCLSCGFARKNRVAGDDSQKVIDKLPVGRPDMP